MDNVELDQQDKDCHRVVAMLDVLGARMHDLTSAKDQLDRILGMYQEVLDIAPAAAAGEAKAVQDITILGDTIIIAINVMDYSTIMTAGALSAGLVVRGLERGIPFRGAIGVGQVAASDRHSIMLGPGITDAAEWYEQLDSVGVIASPRLGMLIEMSNEVSPSQFVQCEVPLRGSNPTDRAKYTERMWAVAWPACMAYFSGMRGVSPARSLLLRNLVQFRMSRGTEMKYLNALAFFDWYAEHHADVMAAQALAGARYAQQGPSLQ